MTVRGMVGAFEQVQAQFQSRSGNWSTVMWVENLPQNITTAMRTVARVNPGCRARAVDGLCRVLDLL
ncbi:hypothetical protein [Xanthobacter agilis]|uniref:hypothetical protein n=1 Tax=Xanthobacter agilis TaxID=47492 RepID=UPI001F3E0133|nr:hypothetical protein [Xanthobacter agilis]